MDSTVTSKPETATFLPSVATTASPISVARRPAISSAVRSLKLSVSLRSAERPFWQARYYDFNLRTAERGYELPEGFETKKPVG